MKISIFVCTINPEYWCFPYEAALKSYCDFADEVVVIDSGSKDGSLEKMKAISNKIRIIHSDWPWTFTQREYPIHYNLGFKECTGDWILKMDIDHVLDPRYYQDLLIRLSHADGMKMATFQRWNFLNRYQYYDKGRMPTALNKKFDTQVGVPIGEDKTDWTVPIEVKEVINGVPHGNRIHPDYILNTGVPVFNYDCFFRDRYKCKVWYQRIARANPSVYGNGDEEAWEHWKAIRWNQKVEPGLKTVKIKDHPEYIREKLKNMIPDMWGHSNWDWNL